MIKLVSVQEKDRDLLWNILQKYLYEMSGYYGDQMDENGDYSYRYFDEYFSDPRRAAYFIYDDAGLAGFAMLNPYSAVGGEPDHTMAEFTIFPSCRRRHLAKDVVRELFRMYPGKWEIKFNENNPAAKRLWETVTAKYEPEIIHINEEETVLSFDVNT